MNTNSKCGSDSGLFCGGIKRCAPEDFRGMMASMRRMNETVDLVFIVGSEKFECHRAWISVASPVLFRMLYSDFKESKQREIVIHGLQPLIFKLMLDFIYLEDITINDWRLGLDVLECSRRFMVEALEKCMLKYLTGIVNVGNACGLLVNAKLLECGELESCAFRFIQYNFHFIGPSEAFTKLKFEIAFEILKNDKLEVRSEIDILRSIVGWLKHNYSSRQYPNFSSVELKRQNEQVQLLVQCFRPEMLCSSEARNARNLSREASLLGLPWNITRRTIQRISFLSPIPAGIRLLHSRTAPVFTVWSRFKRIRLSMSKATTAQWRFSEWYKDPLDLYDWRICVHFRGSVSTSRDKWISCGFEKKSLSKLYREGEKFGCQLFAADADGKVVAVATPTHERTETRKCGHRVEDWNHQAMIDSHHLRCILTKSDTVIFGLTVYYDIVPTSPVLTSSEEK